MTDTNVSAGTMITCNCCGVRFRYEPGGNLRLCASCYEEGCGEAGQNPCKAYNLPPEPRKSDAPEPDTERDWKDDWDKAVNLGDTS